MKIAGIEWDGGNWPKCGKHGARQDEIDDVLRSMTFSIPDPYPNEPRRRTAGQARTGRHVFVVFMYRQRGEGGFIRPISARYMHEKEVKHYEKIKKSLAKLADR